MKPNKPDVVRLVDGYVYRWKDPDWIEIEISEVRRSSGDWKADMVIRSRVPGYEPTHLAETTHNLSALQSRTTLGKTLGERYGLANGASWGDYLEMACVLTVRSEREGLPFTRVGALPEVERPDFWLLDRYIRLHHPTAIWADGSTGKSTLAVLWALAVATGQELAGFNPHFQGPVIWLDWESDEWDIDDTIKKLCLGHNLPLVEFDYRREVWPLSQTFRQVANHVAQNQTALVVIDSAGYAIGGDAEKAGEVLEFTRAVRALNTTPLIIDHVKKGETGGKAYGNVYKYNEVRLGFELLRHQKEGEPDSIIGIKCRKANKGGWPKTAWLRATFADEYIRYEPSDPPRQEDAPELVHVMPLRERIRRVLRGATGLMDADEITGILNEGIEKRHQVSVATVKARLSDMKRDSDVYVSAPSGGFARRYALSSSRDEGEVA